MAQSSWDSMVLPFLQTAGTAFTVAGDYSTAGGIAAASNFNAGVNDQNSAIVLSQGADAAIRQQRIAYLTEGAGRAAIGGSGLRFDGSALDVLAMSASQAELGKQTILYNARVKAMGYNNSATLDRLKGDAAVTQGRMKAASDSILGGAAAYGLLSKMPGTGTPIPEDTSFGSDYGAGYEAMYAAEEATSYEAADLLALVL